MQKPRRVDEGDYRLLSNYMVAFLLKGSRLWIFLPLSSYSRLAAKLSIRPHWNRTDALRVASILYCMQLVEEFREADDFRAICKRCIITHISVGGSLRKVLGNAASITLHYSSAVRAVRKHGLVGAWRNAKQHNLRSEVSDIHLLIFVCSTLITMSMRGHSASGE